MDEATFICNWCSVDADMAIAIATTEHKKEAHYICCSDCLLTAIKKSLGDPKHKAYRKSQLAIVPKGKSPLN